MDENMDVFARSLSCKVVEMLDFVSNGHFQDQNRHIRGVDENLVSDEDLFMEKILENIKEIAILEFNYKDVVRHPLVQKIVKAYQKAESKVQKK